MSKTFDKWLNGRAPRVLTKFADAEIYRVTSFEDGVYTVGPGDGQGTVQELLIKWTWREKPTYPHQFTISFNTPTSGSNPPQFPVKVGGPRILRYAGSNVEGATSFTLRVNKNDDSYKKSWKWEDINNTMDFTELVYGDYAKGPAIDHANGYFRFNGTHQFLEPVPIANAAITLYQSRDNPFGSRGIGQDVYAVERATVQPGSIGLPYDYTGYRRYNETPWQDKFLEIYTPPFGVAGLYSGSGIGLPWNHVWTFTFLFEQTVTCPITALDFTHPLPISTPVASDVVNNVSTGETKTRRGLFADRTMMKG